MIIRLASIWVSVRKPRCNSTIELSIKCQRPPATTDGGIIAAIVILSVGLGFVNEYRSEVAVAELRVGDIVPLT